MSGWLPIVAAVLLPTLPVAAPQQSSAPQVWVEGAPGCAEWLFQGMAYRQLDGAQVRVTVTLADFGPALGAALRIENLSGAPLRVDLRAATVSTQAPREMTLHYRSPLIVTRSVARRPTWTLNAYLAQDGLTSDNSHALEALHAASAEDPVASAHLLAQSLEPASLAPGGVLSGLIFFDPDKRMSAAVVHLPVGGASYEFPFAFR